jgi:hypothetical protein
MPMPRYTVQITFEAPALRGEINSSHSLPGLGAHLQLLASGGLLAVSAVVRADSAADAAMTVATEVGRRWSKTDGALKLLAWKAYRERVFAGRSASQAGGGGGLLFSSDEWFPHDDNGDDELGGTAGVREPRRPTPGPGSLSAALEVVPELPREELRSDHLDERPA